MIRLGCFFLFVLAVGLSACTSRQLDPAAVNTANTYHAQSVSVTPTAAFIASLQGLKGGTPEELAAGFAQEVQSGLQSDLKSVMRGGSPAHVQIEMQSLNVLDTHFSAVGLTVQSTVKIVDATSQGEIMAFDVQADNSDMRNATNRDPMAAFAGTLILKAVVPSKNLGLWNLAKVYRRELKARLGAKAIPGLSGGVL